MLYYVIQRKGMLHGENRYTNQSACNQPVQSPAGASGGTGAPQRLLPDPLGHGGISGTGGGEGELRLLNFYSHYFHITEQPGACAVYAGLWLFCFPSSLPSSPGGTQTRPPSCPAVIRPSSAKGRLSFQPVGDGLAPPAVPSCCGPPETL